MTEHQSTTRITTRISGEIHQIIDRLKQEKRCGKLTVNLNLGGVSSVEFERTIKEPNDGRTA